MGRWDHHAAYNGHIRMSSVKRRASPTAQDEWVEGGEMKCPCPALSTRTHSITSPSILRLTSPNMASSARVGGIQDWGWFTQSNHDCQAALTSYFSTGKTRWATIVQIHPPAIAYRSQIEHDACIPEIANTAAATANLQVVDIIMHYPYRGSQA